MPDAAKEKRPRWPLRLAVLFGIAWAGFLAYLLLVSDPPDFWFEDIASIEDLGHLTAGIVTGSFIFLLLASRSSMKLGWAALTSLVLTLAFLLLLEGLQHVLADRGTERDDITNSVNGTLIGIGVAWLLVWIARIQRGQRRRP